MKRNAKAPVFSSVFWNSRLVIAVYFIHFYFNSLPDHDLWLWRKCGRWFYQWRGWYFTHFFLFIVTLVQGSIADMLRQAATEVLTAKVPPGFVFIEEYNMYYSHESGYYYDQVSSVTFFSKRSSFIHQCSFIKSAFLFLKKWLYCRIPRCSTIPRRRPITTMTRWMDSTKCTIAWSLVRIWGP